jgi:riboflavin kinase / FMN adenylyltransferase
LKVYHNISEFAPKKPMVVTTGTFDGVHIGHQKIINRLKEVAKLYGGETLILTFHPHPRSVLQPDSDVKMLNSQEEKIALLRKFGIEHLVIHPFSVPFSRKSSLEFVRDILVNKLGTQKLVIGYDHHFGRNREGSFEHLLEYGPIYGFDVEEIQALDVDHVNVSSTKIRNALLKGDLDTARKYLIYDYSLKGTVIEGKKLGRSIGFPTANLDVNTYHKLIPANGVYAVRVDVEGVKYNGMLNIGNNPTFDSYKELHIEVHIFKFDENLYGKEITVFFKHKIRDEKKFETIDALKLQLEEDRNYSMRILA